MAITWQVVSVDIGTTKKKVTIQEVVDAVEGKKYSLSLHATAPLSDFKKGFKSLINADRASKIATDSAASIVDLTEFETYLNA